MKKVISRLIEYRKQIDLNERFDYSFDITDTFFSQSEISALSNCDNVFDQNVKLKWILQEKYNSIIDSTTIDFWIVNVWGGIRGFKKIKGISTKY